ncbi:STY0301 family protein [Paracidovorax cattleyae]|uniref:Uncharacterized protein n=1 Tax=Paracidovorax cattleyae TaxID=80868 RepID=A0A1H0TK84_9BURK|nr:STY0301 family protein [Paracidovorax cattleyae]AVS72680.1 hypothetical protein C8240_00150 [Paracidovorax cattleyae]SDP53926.1 hypothetical protein SAMN04489708_11591 [Paracidovorax cattleyae]
MTPSPAPRSQAGRPSLLAILLLAAAGLPGAAMAAPTTLECPATVQLDAPRATASGLPAGTDIVLDTRPLRLTGYNLFDGPPAQGAALVPQSDKPGKGGSTAMWSFEGDYPQGKFLSCDYAGGTVRLVQRTDDAVKRCTAVSRTSGKPSVLQVRFQCE